MLDQAEQDQLRQLIKNIVGVERNVKLAVAFGPLCGYPGDPNACDEALMIDCYLASAKRQRSLSRRIERGTSHVVYVVLLPDLRLYPAILSQALAGEVLKDNSGEWDRLQAEAGSITAAGDQQQAGVEQTFEDELIKRGVIVK